MSTNFHLILDTIKTFTFLTPQQHQVLFDTLLQNVDLADDQKFDLYSVTPFDDYVSEHKEEVQEHIRKILTDPNLLDSIQQIAMTILMDAEQNLAQEEKKKSDSTIGIERTKSEHIEQARIEKTWTNIWNQFEQQSEISSAIVGISTSQFHISLFNSDGEQISKIERKSIPPIHTRNCSEQDYVQEYRISQNEYIDCRLQEHDITIVQNKLVELGLSPILLVEHSFSYPIVHEVVTDMRQGQQYITKRIQATKENIFGLQLESNWNDISFDDREMQMMQLGHQKIYISYVKFHIIPSSMPKNMQIVGYMEMRLNAKIVAQAYQQERVSLCSKWQVFYNHKFLRPSSGTFQRFFTQESSEESHVLERELIPRIRQTLPVHLEEKQVLRKNILIEDVDTIEGFEHTTTFVFDGMIRIQPTLEQSRLNALSSIQMQNFLNFRIGVDDQIEHINFHLPIPDMTQVQRIETKHIIPSTRKLKDTKSFLENVESKNTTYKSYFCKDIPNEWSNE